MAARSHASERAATAAVRPCRRGRSVNADGHWRFCCPEDHTSLVWCAETTVYCKYCSRSYATSAVLDKATGDSLAAYLADPPQPGEDAGTDRSNPGGSIDVRPSAPAYAVVAGGGVIYVLPSRDDAGRVVTICERGVAGEPPARVAAPVTVAAGLLALPGQPIRAFDTPAWVDT